MVLVVPPGHAFVQAEEGVGEATVQSRSGAAGSRLRAAALLREVAGEGRAVSLADLRVALELGSNEAIKEAVLRGVGMAVLSVYAVQKELKAGQLHALEVSDLHLRPRHVHRAGPSAGCCHFRLELFLIFLETHPIAADIP